MPPHHGEAKIVKEEDVVYAGWVLKKKRKKMQGYAKRYLILTRDGALTYSLAPDKPTRDAIEIPHASVTSSKRHGTIHVDSGSSVFHLKTLQPQDFETWRMHLRSFIPERPTGAPQRIYVASQGGTELVSVDLSQVFTSLETVDRLMDEVASKVVELKQADKKKGQGLLGVFQRSPSSSGSSGNPDANSPTEGDTPLASLATLVDTLRAEQANLRYAIESKVPRLSGEEGTMDTLKSRHAPAGPARSRATSRTSVASFGEISGRSDSAVFYDADSAHGEEHVLDDDVAAQEGDLSKGEESSGAEDEDDDETEPEDDGKHVRKTGKPTDSASRSPTVEHRKQLPAKVSGDEVSLFSMLKKNVGKDLSTISFPVSFNCPLSLLQAAAEEYEYAPELLERAAKADDWVERICLVAAFAVSGYASTKLRASRKPFNPLLGETFECVREDKHLRFIAEKVVHQPPIVASYAEGKGWRCQAWNAVKNKFWGKSLELIPEGSSRLEFDDGDVFSFSKPSSFMRNLLAGNKYLEHVGDLTVTNENTGQRCVIEFKEGNMWGGSSSRNVVQGSVYDEHGDLVTNLRGKWHENLARQHDSENYQVLWEAAELPPHAQDYYGFTYFAMSLNEITPDIKPYLPPTDTRFRPDQRAFEEGKVDEAERLKHKVETEQRARRKKREGEGKEYQPHWFHLAKGEEPEWQYGGPNGENYFKQRAKAANDSAADKENGDAKGEEGNAWTGIEEIF